MAVKPVQTWNIKIQEYNTSIIVIHIFQLAVKK